MEEGQIRVTVDMFSGRSNPVLEFRGDDLKDLLDRMAPGASIEKERLGLLPTPTLGYRALVVEQVGIPDAPLPSKFRVAAGAALGPDFAYQIADETFEDDICGGVPKDILATEELLHFRGILDYWFERAAPEFDWPVEPVCPSLPCTSPRGGTVLRGGPTTTATTMAPTTGPIRTPSLERRRRSSISPTPVPL